MASWSVTQQLMNQERAIAGICSMLQWFLTTCDRTTASSYVMPLEGSDYFSMATLREAFKRQQCWKQRRLMHHTSCTSLTGDRYQWSHESEWITPCKKKIRVYANKTGNMVYNRAPCGRFSITLVNQSAMGGSRLPRWYEDSRSFCIPCAALAGIINEEQREGNTQGCIRMQRRLSRSLSVPLPRRLRLC